MKRNKERLKYILTSLLKGYKSTSPSRIQTMMMCVGEAERGRDSLGSCFHALPANSSEVTLGGRQDKSFYADGAKQPSTPPAHILYTDWHFTGQGRPLQCIFSIRPKSVWSGLKQHNTHLYIACMTLMSASEP